MSIFTNITEENLHFLLANISLNADDTSENTNSSQFSQKTTEKSFLKKSRNINCKEMSEAVSNSDIASLCATLPIFSKEDDNISTFIKSVDNLIAFLIEQNLTAPQQFILNANIVSRIKGEPRNFLNYSNKTVWADIRPALLSKYGDRRSEDILVTQLSTTVQKFNETYDQYHQRVSNNLNDLLQHITLNDNEPTVNFKTPYFKNIALKTFCTGVNEPYCEYLSHFQTSSLEEALQKCIAYDNHKNQQQYMNFLKGQQNKKHFSPTKRPNNPAPPSNVRPNYSRNHPQQNFNSQPQSNFNSFRNTPSNNTPRNSFQSNNFRNNYSQRFNRSPLLRNNTNAQNNSNHTPMSGVQTINSRNEPMSTSTRRTHHFNLHATTEEEPEFILNDYENHEKIDGQDFQIGPTNEPPPL